MLEPACTATVKMCEQRSCVHTFVFHPGGFYCKVIPLSLTLSVCHSVTSSIPRSIIKIQQPLSTQRKTEADNQTHIIHSHNQTKHTHDIQNIKGSDIYRIAALYIAVVGNYIHMSKRTHRLQIALYFYIFVFYQWR